MGPQRRGMLEGAAMNSSEGARTMPLGAEARRAFSHSCLTLQAPFRLKW